jgi:sulfatase modifying factor 1
MSRRVVAASIVLATTSVALGLGAAPKLKPVSLNAAPNKGSSKSVAPAPKVSTPKGCPPGMAPIPNDKGGFCIDRYEAGVVEVVGKKTKAHSPFEAVTNKKVRAVSRQGIVPQGYISALEAKAACEEAGKRLCTPDEWLKACQGTKPHTYPYGDDEVKGRCNGDGTRQHPVVELFGSSQDAFGDPSKMNDPRLNQLPGTVAKTGAHAKCKNAWGVYDMVGNLHEWTSDATGSAQFKGGYYMDTHKNGDGCFYKTTAHAPAYHDYSTGFRCCR